MMCFIKDGELPIQTCIESKKDIPDEPPADMMEQDLRLPDWLAGLVE
jgi:hypothetical protein